MLMRDSRGISNDLVEECRKSFSYFDKAKKQYLEPKEFKVLVVWMLLWGGCVEF